MLLSQAEPADPPFLSSHFRPRPVSPRACRLYTSPSRRPDFSPLFHPLPSESAGLPGGSGAPETLPPCVHTTRLCLPCPGMLGPAARVKVSKAGGQAEGCGHAGGNRCSHIGQSGNMYVCVCVYVSRLSEWALLPCDLAIVLPDPRRLRLKPASHLFEPAGPRLSKCWPVSLSSVHQKGARRRR